MCEGGEGICMQSEIKMWFVWAEKWVKKAWKILKKCEKTWKYMKKHETAWKNMKRHEKKQIIWKNDIMKSMKNRYIIKRNLKEHNRINICDMRYLMLCVWYEWHVFTWCYASVYVNGF